MTENPSSLQTENPRSLGTDDPSSLLSKDLSCMSVDDHTPCGQIILVPLGLRSLAFDISYMYYIVQYSH